MPTTDQEIETTMAPDNGANALAATARARAAAEPCDDDNEPGVIIFDVLGDFSEQTGASFG